MLTNCSKTKIVADTSSLVSLQTGDILEYWRALPKLIEKSASINVVVSAFVIRSLLNRYMLTMDDAKAVLDRIARERGWLESQIYEESKKWMTK